ncbi:hypothetical protein LINPERHAP1_LOCUS21091 [Linum perenne]
MKVRGVPGQESRSPRSWERGGGGGGLPAAITFAEEEEG